MIEIEGKLRTWGNSYGVIIPKGEAEKADLHEGDTVKLRISKEKSTMTLRDMFGIWKGKKMQSTDEMMREMDKELWDE